MANKDAAFGFKPVRHLTGGQIRTEEYAIAANHGTNIFSGNVVEAQAAGGIENAAAGDTQQLGVFGGVSTLIQQQVNQHTKHFIQQALTLLILWRMFMQTLRSCLKHNMTALEQRL